MRGMDSATWKVLACGAAMAATIAAGDDGRVHSLGRFATPAHTASSPQVIAPPREPVLRQQESRASWSAALDHQGRQRIDHAYDLASRGAVHSAKQELLAVLTFVAQALDTDQQTTAHCHALASAQTALDEAGDFVAGGAPGVSATSLDSVISSHRTPVLHDVDTGRLTPLIALQQYFSHATRQFAFAARGQPVAAEALFGLGRVTALRRDQSPSGEPTAPALSEQEILVFYQAAWMVDRHHHRAANELGVSLARFDQWPQAARAFEYSVAQHPEPRNCQNLALAYERLGAHQLAQQARARCRQLQAVSSGNPRSSAMSPTQIAPAVAWVDVETFMASEAPTGWTQPHWEAGPSSPADDLPVQRTGGSPRTPRAAPAAGPAASAAAGAPQTPLQRFKAVFSQSAR